MIDQKILDFIANDPEGRKVGEQCVRDLEADIQRTRFIFNHTIDVIERMLKDNVTGEAKKHKEEILGKLEVELQEINKEIRQVHEALAQRKD
jgi:phosphotransferase system IIB component